MSRKLIFAAGLAHVFFCHLDSAAEQAREELKRKKEVTLLTAYLTEQLALAPLETLAKACNELAVSGEVSAKIFNNYDRFLEILDDAGKREELAKAKDHEELRKSSAWKEIREISAAFHEGLVALFLGGQNQLSELTMKYGVF